MLWRPFIYKLTIVPAALFLACALWTAWVIFYPAEPVMREATSRYEMKLVFAPLWPFLYKYYVYKPARLVPGQKYPLVVLLHGVSRHMHGGRYILADEIIGRHPAFVLVPIAPQGTIWAYPGIPAQKTAAVIVRDAIEDVTAANPVDRARIYISGYSMGGVGTFGMIVTYPDLFAAGMPLCGNWKPEDAASFPADVPILALHGSLDRPELSRNMVATLQQAGRPALYIEYPGVGHNVWDYAYTDPAIWDWLFAQQRRR